MKQDQPAAPETRGVTVTLLAALDLGAEIEGMAGRQLRMRMVTIEPGGVFGPVHDHKDRPGMVYVLHGAQGFRKLPRLRHVLTRQGNTGFRL